MQISFLYFMFFPADIGEDAPKCLDWRGLEEDAVEHIDFIIIRVCEIGGDDINRKVFETDVGPDVLCEAPAVALIRHIGVPWKRKW